MWPASNPFSNRQAAKRNHENVEYQNEKDPLPKLCFHFGSPLSPICYYRNPTTEDTEKRFLFKAPKKWLFPPPLCPLIFNLLTSSFDQIP